MSDAGWVFYTHVHAFADGEEQWTWIVYGPTENPEFVTCRGSGTAVSEDQATKRAKAYIAQRAELA